jgi:Family of unknown function (DUF6376)
MAGAKGSFTMLAVGGTIVLLAAGCGGGGSKSSTPTTTGTMTAAEPTTTVANSTPLAKAAYVRQMKAIGRSLSTSLNSLGAATTAQKAATALQEVQTDLRHAADRIESLTPPAAVKAQHAQLAKAVRDFADELDPVITKLKGGNMQALSTVPTLKGLQEIQTASTQIASKGYKIGG